MLTAFARRVRYLLRYRDAQRELAEEMSLHRELRGRALNDNYEAARLFGNLSSYRESASDMWGWRWLEDLGRDLRHTAQLLANNKSFATVAILTMALGIGANTAIFSVTDALLLRMLPVPDPQQIVHVGLDRMPDGFSDTGDPTKAFSYEVFRRLQSERSETWNLMSYVPLGFNKIGVRTGSQSEEASVHMVSGNFFSGLQVRLLCGRPFTSADEEKGSAIAIVSETFAVDRFGSACSAIDRSVTVRGVPLTITGVTPRSFAGVVDTPTDIWLPFQNRDDLNAWGSQQAHFKRNARWWCLLMIARLKGDLTPPAAEAALQISFQRAAYAYHGGVPPEGEHPTRLHLRPARGFPADPDFKVRLMVLQAMVGVLLLIACGNLATLLAVRNTARQREFSVRKAIGGSSGRLFRQLLVESLVLVSAGTLLGVGLAFPATRVLARWSQIEISLAPNRNVLLLAAVVSLLISVVFGLLPAFAAIRAPLSNAVKGNLQRSARWLTSHLAVAIQIAFCVLLLGSSGLLVQSLQNLHQIPFGFDPDGLLVFGITSPPTARTDPERFAFFRGLRQKLLEMPQLESVTSAENRPGSSWSNNTDALVDGAVPINHGNTLLRWNAVGPDYLSTMRIPILQGRDLRESDSAGSPLVALVNEAFSKAFLDGRSPIGHSLSFANRPYLIVGVAQNNKYTNIQEQPMPTAWFPATQTGGFDTLHFEVRTRVDPESAWPMIRRAVASYSADAALLQPRTQRAEFERSIQDSIFLARLSTCFAILAAVLVIVGLYGTISYVVELRTSELGLRLALGAQRNHVLWLILRTGLSLSALGIFTGIPLALATGRYLSSLLYQVSATDLTTLITTVVVVLLISVLASYLPALRASRLDPALTLRHD